MQVVPLRLHEVGDRVGPRGDRLCLECLDRPVLRHLPRHDAEEVVLQPDDVDELELGARLRDPEIAPVALVGDGQVRPGHGAERERPREGELLAALADGELELRPDGHRAHGQHVALAVRVEHREGVRQRDLRQLVADEDADALDDAGGRGPDLGAAVVVPEDRPVVAPGLRLAERAPLAHPDTVPPAAAGEDEGGLRRLRRARRGRRRDGGERGRRVE